MLVFKCKRGGIETSEFSYTDLVSDLDVEAEEGEFVVPAFLGLFAPGECVECVDFAGVVGGGGLYFALLEGGVKSAGVVEEWVACADGCKKWWEGACGLGTAFEENQGIGEVDVFGQGGGKVGVTDFFEAVDQPAGKWAAAAKARDVADLEHSAGGDYGCGDDFGLENVGGVGFWSLKGCGNSE